MNKNLIFVSFLSTNYSALAQHWKKYSVLRKKGKFGSNKAFRDKMGGKISLVDWDKKKIVWEKYVDSPSGILFHRRKLYFNSINQGKIFVLNFPRGNIVKEINNPLFNKPHSLQKTKNGFLVASTGLDLIVEVNKDGKSIFTYFLTEHGYSRDQFGKRRVLDTSKNYQTAVFPSLSQTTHVNFATYRNTQESEIIATLFHRGEVVLINKKTGELKVVMRNLKQPHNFKFFSKKLSLVSDTNNNKALYVNNKTFKVEDQVVGDFLWVQDAVKSDKSIYVADADHHRIVRIGFEDKRVLDEYIFSKSDRIYQILPIKKL